MGFQKGGDLYLSVTRTADVPMRSEPPKLRGEELQILALTHLLHGKQLRGNGIIYGVITRRQ